MIKKRSLFFSLIGLFLLSSNVYAISEQPSVNINIELPLIGKCKANCNEEIGDKNIKPQDFLEMSVLLKFFRHLNHSKDIIDNNTMYKMYSFDKKIKKVKNKYKFLILYKNWITQNYDLSKFNDENKGYVKYKGIYILDENNICIGYCLMEKTYFGHQKDAIEIYKMRSLKKSNNFLKNKIVNPKLDFYEKDHGNYIERYAISDDFFEMQSFYPKELEKNLETRIKKVLNYNYIHGVDYEKISNNKLKGLENYEINPDSEDDENELDED